MEIQYQNVPRDLRLALKVMPFWERFIARNLDLLFWALVALIPPALWCAVRGDWFTSIAGGVPVFVILAAFGIFLWRATLHSPDDFKAQTLRIGPDWIDVVRLPAWSRRNWRCVNSVDLVRGSVVIRVDGGWWFVVPARAFPNPDMAREFVSAAQSYRSAFLESSSPPPMKLPEWFDRPNVEVAIEFKATKDDFKLLVSKGVQPKTDSGKPPAKPSKFGCFWLAITLVFVVVLMPSNATSSFGLVFAFFMMWLAIVAASLYFWLRFKRHYWLKGFEPARERYSVSLGGLLIESENRSSFTGWDDVTGVIDTDQQVVFQIRPKLTMFVPKHAFASSAEAERFHGVCHEFWTSYHQPNAPLPALLVDTGNPYQPPTSI